MEKSQTFAIRAQGPLACFTRPELKVERVSYEMMTPSAARGILEAILWKPAIAWRIEKITRLSDSVRWISLRRNEVGIVASERSDGIFVEDNRQQRSTVALRDVDYVVHAHFEMTDQKGPEDSLRKFEEMFDRRLHKGQHFYQPYLGCREFAAAISPAPLDYTLPEPGIRRPLGMMLFDFLYPNGGSSKGNPARPLFFQAILDSGVLRVPDLGDVLKENGLFEAES